MTDAFRQKYIRELDQNAFSEEFARRIRQKLADGNVTFLYAAKNREFNHAVILKEWLEARNE